MAFPRCRPPPRTALAGRFSWFLRELPQPVRLDFAKHAADLTFDIAREINGSLRIDDFAHPPQLPPADLCFANRIRDLVPPAMRVLAVHPETSPHKMLPLPRLVAALDGFLELNPDIVVFDVSYDDLGLDSGRHAERVVPCTGRSLTEAIALVSRADLFLGVDSCMLHAADLFRVPGVALFGPTIPRVWGFRFSPHYHHVTGTGAMDMIDNEEVVRCLQDIADAQSLPVASNVHGTPRNGPSTE